MNKSLRPAKINKIFDEVLDLYRVCFLGIASLHVPEIQRCLLSIPDNISGMGIASSFVGEDANFSIKDAIKEIQLDQQKSPQFLTKNVFATLTRIFIIYCYNLLEEDGLLKKIWQEPIIQFFRHLRNGCAHNNIFYFEGKKKLELPAEWKGKEITTSLEGKIVVNDFFKEGDLIHLLEDISNLI